MLYICDIITFTLPLPDETWKSNQQAAANLPPEEVNVLRTRLQMGPLPPRLSTKQEGAATALMNPGSIRDPPPRLDDIREARTHARKGDEKDGLPGKVASHGLHFVYLLDNAKAKVETAVGIAERKVLGSLRDRTFFSLSELNKAIVDIREELNNKKFQKLDVCRRELFEQLDHPAMKSLPPKRYEYSEWSTATVNIDYHVDVKKIYYSVHYSLIHKRVDVRLTASTVELFFKGRRVASHPRYYIKGKHRTQNDHMPPGHQKYLEWTPERILAWAGKAGPCTKELLERIMGQRRHPEQAYRSCLGVLRLAKKCTPERLENACRRAIKIQGYSYKSVKSILDKGLDSQPLPEEKATQELLPFSHKNIRGAHYYTNPTKGGENYDFGTDPRETEKNEALRPAGGYRRTD